MAAEAFLRLLRYLRVTFLQDVVHWRQRLSKDFFLWQHPLFSDSEYLEFEVAARESTLSRSSHWDSQLRAALPRMVDTLDGRLGEQTAAIRSTKAEISKANTSLGRIEQKQDAQETLIAQLWIANRQLSEQLRTAVSASSQSHSFTITGVTAAPIPSISHPDAMGNLDTSSTSNTALTSEIDMASSAPPNSSPSDHNPSSSILPSNNMEAYAMSRSVANVEEAWREYTIGLNGKPSVRAMYEHKDRSRRRWDGETERHFYTQRRVIYRAVQAMATHRKISEPAAALALDLFRREADSKKILSLKDLVKIILDRLAEGRPLV